MVWRAGPWLRFALFLGANGLGLILLAALAITSGAELLQEQRKRIDASLSIIERAALVKDKEASLSSVDPADIQAASRLFLYGKTTSLLSAELLSRLRSAGDKHGIAFSSVSTLPEREWQGRRFVGVRVEFSAATQQAADFLLAIEDGAPFLVSSETRLSGVSERTGAYEDVTAVVDVYGAARWTR
jgi:hypothetical protein